MKCYEAKGGVVQHWVVNPSTSPECGCGWPYYGPNTAADKQEFERMIVACDEDVVAAVEQHIRESAATNVDILDVMAETITDDWDVDPGYARELSRRLVMKLEKKGIFILPRAWRGLNQ